MPRRPLSFRTLAAVFACLLAASPCLAQTFNSAPVQAVAGTPYVMATGDFDRDGHPDLVYLDAYINGTLHVMHGLGNGTFTELQQIPFPGTGAVSITVADFNGDGFPDLVLNGNYSAPGTSIRSFAVLLNRGDGTFLTPVLVPYTAPGIPGNLLAADFDGDGKIDLLFASSNFILMRGDGTGHFTQQVLAATDANGVITADLNGDGKPDLIFAGNYTIEYALNTGNGTFGPIQTLDSNPASLRTVFAADLNRDGHQDILYARNGMLTIAFGKGDGTFTTPASFGPLSANILAVTDFNGDGLADIVTSNAAGPIVLLQNAAGHFSSNTLTGPAIGDRGLAAPVFADFDGDGTGDIVTGAAGSLVFSRGNPLGSFAGATATVTPGAIVDLQPADLNQDGNLDLAATDLISSISSTIATYLGDGTGNFALKTTATNGFAFGGRSAIADLNSDGIPDIFNGGDALFSDGRGGFTSTNQIATFQFGSQSRGYTASADFNEDGRPDLLTSTQPGNYTGKYSIALSVSNGAGPWISTQLACPEPPGPIVSGDFNHDGHTDIAVVGTSSIFLYTGDGRGNLTLATTLPVSYTVTPNYPPNNFNDLEAADLDGDGNLDLLVPIPDKNLIQIFYGRGDGTFDSPVSLPTAQDVRFVTVADMNADGIPDLILSGHALVRILHGLGHRTFESTPTSYAANGYPQKVRVADVNHDGNPDLLVPNGGFSELEELGLSFTVLLNAAPPVNPNTLVGSLACTPEPSTLGQPFSCTVTFEPAANTASPVGTVTFLLNGATAGNAILSGQSATFAFSAPQAGGTYAIEADFPGDKLFLPAKAIATHTVSLPTPTLTLSGTASGPYGSSFPVSAVLNPNGANATPTGTIHFLEGAVTLQQASVASSAATAALTGLTPGPHVLNAKYSGDPDFNPATSNPIILTVGLIPTNTTFTATPATAPFATPIAFQFAVTAPTAPSGTSLQATLNLLDAGQIIASAPATATGTAFLALSTLAIGQHTLTAAFTGSPVLAASSSAPVLVTITAPTAGATATTLTASPNPSAPFQPVTLAAVVSTSTGALTGTIRFFDATTPLADASIDPTGKATFTTSTLQIGTHPLSAQYLGSPTAQPSTSPIVQQVVLDTDYILSLNPTTLTLQTQHHATLQIIVKSIGAFPAGVTLACGTLPTHATCRIAAQTLSGFSNNSQQSTSFYLDTSDVIGYASTAPTPQPRSTVAAVLRCALLLPLSLLLFRRKSAAQRLLACTLVLLPAALFLSACSGKYPASVAPGTYTIPIVATSSTGVTHTAQLQLVVTE